jgi:hypothetical protein
MVFSTRNHTQPAASLAEQAARTISVRVVGRLRDRVGLLLVAAWLERSCNGFAKSSGHADVDA